MNPLNHTGFQNSSESHSESHTESHSIRGNIHRLPFGRKSVDPNGWELHGSSRAILKTSWCLFVLLLLQAIRSQIIIMKLEFILFWLKSISYSHTMILTPPHDFYADLIKQFRLKTKNLMANVWVSSWISIVVSTFNNFVFLYLSRKAFCKWEISTSLPGSWERSRTALQPSFANNERCFIPFPTGGVSPRPTTCCGRRSATRCRRSNSCSGYPTGCQRSGIIQRCLCSLRLLQLLVDLAGELGRGTGGCVSMDIYIIVTEVKVTIEIYMWMSWTLKGTPRSVWRAHGIQYV